MRFREQLCKSAHTVSTIKKDDAAIKNFTTTTIIIIITITIAIAIAITIIIIMTMIMINKKNLKKY